MAKKKEIALITVFVVCFILSTNALVLHFVPKNKEFTASDVYEECLYNVVEVKATSENVGESFDTGEIVSTDGKIITNAHVVTYSRLGATNEFENYYIRFAFEDEYRLVTLEKYDTDLDLAVLKLPDVSDVPMKPIRPGNSDNLKSGETVFAVGNASNYGHYCNIAQLCVAFYLCYFCNNANNSQVSANSRTIELSQSAVDAQSVLNEFDDATLTQDGSTVYFEG
ncbi:MAG: serine protease [Clostridia bacterium]|nr:serine protease [Clostridia bacterium]